MTQPYKIIFIQIKDWRRNVGTDIIAQMIGILSKNPGSKGMIISKQGFTKTAIEEVKNRKENDLILINGESEIEEKYEKLSETKLDKSRRNRMISMEGAEEMVIDNQEIRIKKPRDIEIVEETLQQLEEIKKHKKRRRRFYPKIEMINEKENIEELP